MVYTDENYVWSQSALKEFEKEESCPRKWRETYVTKTIKGTSSQAMDYGSYFEYLVIGGSAKDEGTITDLPRNANGSKKAAQIRIEKQAEWAKSLFDPESENYTGLKIIDTQVVFTYKNQKGIVDILAEKEDGTIVDIDLKLTADVTNTRGEYSWGNAHSRDYLQFIHYHSLIEKTLNKVPETQIIICDYSPKMGRKHIDLQITDASIVDVEERFEEAEEVRQVYIKDGFTEYPSMDECESCPLKCGKRFKLTSPELETITV